MLNTYKYFFFSSWKKNEKSDLFIIIAEVSHRVVQMSGCKTDLLIKSPREFLQDLQEHRLVDYAPNESTILLLEFGPSWNNLIPRVEINVL